MTAAVTSPTTGRRYGVARVCRVWELPRSSFYAARQKAATAAPPPPPRRRGPTPAVSDEALLAAIRADLARSPWHGEGHRKVWARLRVIDGIRVARRRVLRPMREHTLLSPHRARPRAATPHDRHIITGAPNLMWATDATQITTVRDGKVWLFGVVEHWNAELLGWHVAKRGDRFEAVQAVGMALRQAFGHLGAGAARGLALRHDHGSSFMAEHFQNQIRFWGMSPSYAFVGEPETTDEVEQFLLREVGTAASTAPRGILSAARRGQAPQPRNARGAGGAGLEDGASRRGTLAPAVRHARIGHGPTGRVRTFTP